MTVDDKIKRAFAFYFAVCLFFVLLPILISYSLGYQIDYHKFRIYKTGIIYLNSTPSGASIYINGKKDKDLTPAQIEELRPGTYRVEVRKEGFYPWEKELVVRPNMVIKADKIVLFQTMQEMNKIGERETMDFAISGKNYIYYMTKSGLFRSSMDGNNLRYLSSYSNWPHNIIGKKFSPDDNKLACFNQQNVWVIYLNPEITNIRDSESARVVEVLTSTDPIMDIFWYSGSNYIIVVTERDIKVVEFRSSGAANIVSLYKFNSKPRSFYYDDNNDSLYFTDTAKEFAMKYEGNIYRLDLRKGFMDSLRDLLPKKEQEAGYEKR